MGVILFQPRYSEHPAPVIIRAARIVVLALGIALSVTALIAAPTAKAQSITTETRAALFSELQAYLTRHTNNGVFTLTNDPTVKPVGITLKNLHPLVLKKTGVYMLCADFVAPDGKNILIDFFLKPVADKPGAFQVLYYVVGNRSRFMRLFVRLI